MEQVFLYTPLWKQLTSCLQKLEQLAEEAGSDVDRISGPYTAMAVSGMHDRNQLRALGMARKAIFSGSNPST